MKLLDLFKSKKTLDHDKALNKALVSSGMQNWNFTSDLSECGDLIINLELFYRLQKTNPSCQSMKDLVALKVSKNGLYLENQRGDIADKPSDREYLKRVIDYFSTPTLQSFKGDYFTHYFAGGEVFLAEKETVYGKHPVLVDNRTMSKKIDKTGSVVGFKQQAGGYTKEYTLDTMYNHIVKRDPDRPNFGISKYNPIIYDGLSSTEISKRNYYFFQNNAKPGIVLMMKQIPNMKPEEYAQALRTFEEKYSGAKNNGKVAGGNFIEDIKVLEMNHKDLQLLELDVLTIKKVGMIFGIDPRLLGFSDDVGAYATMTEIARHSLEALNSYQTDFEVDINNIWRLFVDPASKYIIRCDGETFENRKDIEIGQREDVKLGILTIEEIRGERGLSINNLPDQAKKHYIMNNLSPIDTINANTNNPQTA